MKKIFLIIPVYNESKVLKETLEEIKQYGYDKIIVVDDGSSDDSFDIARKECLALKLEINRGKGAAVKTGIEAAKKLGADVVVTLDGDGQHNPKDIKKMLQLINDKYDVVLGSRLKNPQGMPWYKIMHNQIGNFFTWIIYGLWVSDSQSGFRAYSRKAIDLIDTKTDRYEYDSEIIREIKKHKLSYTEIPIEVRYTQYSMNKKNKQNFINGIKTLIKMLIYS